MNDFFQVQHENEAGTIREHRSTEGSREATEGSDLSTEGSRQKTKGSRAPLCFPRGNRREQNCHHEGAQRNLREHRLIDLPIYLSIDLFKYFGVKINFAKSLLIPSQTIDFLGYSLDARKCRLTLTQEKLFKCRLITKCLSRLRSIGVKLLQCILGFLNFALQLFPLGRSFIRPLYKLASNFALSRVNFDPSPLAHLRDVFFKGPLFAFWPSGVAQPSLPCFVDATPSRVAGISGQGGFALSLHAPRPIFEAQFLASFYGIGMYQPISNNIHLIGDNLGVLFCLKRGSSHNLFANEILISLAHFWLNSPFFLNISYVKSADNPADFYTHYF